MHQGGYFRKSRSGSAKTKKNKSEKIVKYLGHSRPRMAEAVAAVAVAVLDEPGRPAPGDGGPWRPGSSGRPPGCSGCPPARGGRAWRQWQPRLQRPPRPTGRIPADSAGWADYGKSTGRPRRLPPSRPDSGRDPEAAEALPSDSMPAIWSSASAKDRASIVAAWQKRRSEESRRRQEVDRERNF